MAGDSRWRGRDGSRRGRRLGTVALALGLGACGGGSKEGKPASEAGAKKPAAAHEGQHTQAAGPQRTESPEGQGAGAGDAAKDDGQAVKARPPSPTKHGLVAEVDAVRERAAASADAKADGIGSAEFRAVETREELRMAFEDAQKHERLVLVDVAATWCLPCKELEKITLVDPKVQALISEHYLPVRVDVTMGDDQDLELQRLLDADSLPAIRVYRPTPGAIADIDKGEKALAAPLVRLLTFVQPDELERQLRDAAS